ncbi:helix-turn-helix domain-containing protein [Chelativorans sp.]|uniref:helix-turn-helix domain-containing protein n=1 Tax=Chelativorans sp. TaxID=2203393 RepID=UPI002811DB34|nr:helix-turn-helix domain-containing protein [Chelativorans sp.]
MKGTVDKRDLSGVFRERLKTLMGRSGLNQSAFASAVGIDRSALSQLLAGSSTRLPRAETLMNIAAHSQVSMDWLLGLSQDEVLTAELRENMEIAEAEGGFGETLLAKWHAEAVGTKIRYVPARIPDLLRTEKVILYDAEAAQHSREAQIDEAHFRVNYNRRPETDMEVCMPRQTLEVFAKGEGIWRQLPREARAEQIAHMAELLDDLYPTFRLFLYDGRRRFSAPYTVFGPYRAALYLGGLYLVLNATQPIATLTRHFDGLIRAAEVNAHEAAAFVKGLPLG